MQKAEIRGIVRTANGKSGVRQVREAGRTPAVVYGKGEESLAISLDSRELDGVLRQHGGTFVLDLTVEGPENRDFKTIIKEMQRDPVTSRILHVDLMHVSMSQVIHLKVPVHLTGMASGVKEGGILEHLCREVEIECQAARIPEALRIDVSEMAIGDSLHVVDLEAPAGVTILTPESRVIAAVVAKAVVEEPTAEEKAAEEAPAEGQEEGEKKAEEAPEEASPKA